MNAPAVLDEDFAAQVFQGRLRWDLLQPFPEQTEEDRGLGDQAVARMRELLLSTVDPEAVDREGRLPASYLDALHRGGFFEGTNPPEFGGRGLSSYNVFRVLESAMAWSIPAGHVLAVHHGLGVGAIDRLLPEGALRDLVRGKLADGVISTWADSEPSGAANAQPATYAVPVDGGAAYRIHGRKCFIANGSIAGLINVTATLREGDRETVRVFVVDTASPGFHVREEHELMGFRGLPIHVLAFDGVLVPRECILPTNDGDWRRTPLLESIRALARMYAVVCPASAISKNCLVWSREFATRRIVNRRPLGEYERIQRMIAATAADVFAMDSIVHYALIGAESTARSRLHTRIAAKNIASRTCWRVVDRTMSLFASEGLETARSKAGRGVPSRPIERAFRDARGLRITGGVDFLVDITIAKSVFSSYYDADPVDVSEMDPGSAVSANDSSLSAANQAHLAFSSREARRLAGTMLALARRYPERETLFEQQELLVSITRIMNEILAMSMVLARTSRQASCGEALVQDLADVYCSQARRRLADAWWHLDAPWEPNFARVSRAWLAGTDLKFLEASKS